MAATRIAQNIIEEQDFVKEYMRICYSTPKTFQSMLNSQTEALNLQGAISKRNHPMIPTFRPPTEGWAQWCSSLQGRNNYMLHSNMTSSQLGIKNSILLTSSYFDINALCPYLFAYDSFMEV